MELNMFRWAFMVTVMGIYFVCKRTAPSIPRGKILFVLFYGTLVSLEQVRPWGMDFWRNFLVQYAQRAFASRTRHCLVQNFTGFKVPLR